MMQYTATYQSPLGDILLAADAIGLTGLWFAGQKYYARGLAQEHERRQLPVFTAAIQWLDSYFAGKAPEQRPPLHLLGTEFQQAVWACLQTIPYGQTVTYGQIARQLAGDRDGAGTFAQAVGGAVSHNPVSILVPCHRVVGANGSLTGYAGGIDKKIALLKLEGGWQQRFFVPKRSTAP